MTKKKARQKGTRANDSRCIAYPNLDIREQKQKLSEIKWDVKEDLAFHQEFRGSRKSMRRQARKKAQGKPMPEIYALSELELIIWHQHEESKIRQRLPLEKSVDSYDVLVILRIVSKSAGYRYAMIKDTYKGKLGFVIGGKDDAKRGIVDIDFEAAAKREAREEALCHPDNNSLELHVHPDGCIGTIDLGDYHHVNIFVIDIAHSAKIMPGKDQEWAGIRSFESIDARMIPQDVLLPTHAKAWGIYKNWLARQV